MRKLILGVLLVLSSCEYKEMSTYESEGNIISSLKSTDNDGDGLSDTYEDYLLQKFSPRIWLHSSENRWPVNVDYLLFHSRLRFAHPLCSDCGILDYFDVTRANLTEQQHKKKRSPALLCKHYGSKKSSAGFVGKTTETFFLQYLDPIHDGIGPGRIDDSSRSKWDVYGHVYPLKSGKIVIQYWQLYAYNDSFASANHEGDWEYSGVVINRQQQPIKVIFYRHGREVDYSPDQVEWVGDHHVTYSAKGGHGQYRGVSGSECRGDDIWDRTQGFADDCNQGTAWNSWDSHFGKIVNVGEKTRPLNSSNWIRYSGLWGEIGAAGSVIDFTSGPRGPAYKTTSWLWAPSDDVPGPPDDDESNDDCIPKCNFKECGPDGCGGSCGSCGIRSYCRVGMCVPEGGDIP